MMRNCGVTALSVCLSVCMYHPLSPFLFLSALHFFCDSSFAIWRQKKLSLRLFVETSSFFCTDIATLISKNWCGSKKMVKTLGFKLVDHRFNLHDVAIA